MLEYYFSEGFGILELYSNYFNKILDLEKQIFHAEETHDLEYFITCDTTLPSISNTLKKLWLQ